MQYTRHALRASTLFSTGLMLVVAASPAIAQGGAAAGEVLTNESIVQMVTAKVPKDLILTKIRGTKSNFDITAMGLVALNADKVSTDLMKAMMTAAGTSNKETLNNDAVIKMVAGGVSRDIILSKIQMSKANYDLTTTGVINLNQNKVAQDVIKAMMTASAAPVPPPPPPGRRGGGGGR